MSVIDRLVQNYADIHLPQYPCIPRPMLDDIVKRTRQAQDLGPEIPSTLDHCENFVLFIALAISTMTLTWQNEDEARKASESFYNSALVHLRSCDDISQLNALRVSLLLAHYAHMCPERVDNWTCISNAIRIILNLGLYLEAPESMPVEQAQQRSELFWVAYGMERSLCSIVRLPLSFPEEAITAKVRVKINTASPYDWVEAAPVMDKGSSANQIRKLRALETEMHRVLHLEEDLQQIGNFITIESWIQDIDSRVELWYSEALQFTQHNMLEFKHIQYNHLRARIHRRTPRLRLRTDEDRRIVLDASRKLIEDYAGQERRCRLFYPWHGVHILFEAAVISLEACWSARDWVPLRDEADHMLRTYIPQCLRIITNMGARWDGAIACADRLRPLVQKVKGAFNDRITYPLLVHNDAMISDELEGLLFSDGPLNWHQATLVSLGFDIDNSSWPNNWLPMDDMETFQWDPTWADFIPDASLSTDAHSR